MRQTFNKGQHQCHLEFGFSNRVCSVSSALISCLASSWMGPQWCLWLSDTHLVTNDKNPTHMNLRLECIEEFRGVADFKPDQTQRLKHHLYTDVSLSLSSVLLCVGFVLNTFLTRWLQVALSFHHPHSYQLQQKIVSLGRDKQIQGDDSHWSIWIK